MYPGKYEFVSTQIFRYEQDATQGQFLSRVQLVWIQSFPSSYPTKTKEARLSYYLPIAGGKTDGFMLFSRALVRSVTRTISSRIWTLVTDSITNGDNRYTNHPHQKY